MRNILNKLALGASGGAMACAGIAMVASSPASAEEVCYTFDETSPGPGFINNTNFPADADVNALECGSGSDANGPVQQQLVVKLWPTALTPLR